MTTNYERHVSSAVNEQHTNTTELTHHRQNNSRLDELQGKVTALREVTTNIYEHARDQSVIDNSVRFL